MEEVHIEIPRSFGSILQAIHFRTVAPIRARIIDTRTAIRIYVGILC